MRNNSPIIFLAIICIAAGYSNYLALVSNQQQFVLLQDFENMKPKAPLELIKTFNYEYPTLSAYAVPLKTYLARYYMREDSIEIAKSLFKEAMKISPHHMVNQNYLSELYESQCYIDSFNYYATEAYTKMPNHPYHLAYYFKNIIAKDEVDIDSVFDQLSTKSYTYWKIYLAAVLNRSIKTEKTIENVKFVKKKYPTVNEIQLTADYILYGYDKVNQAIEFDNAAKQFYNSKDYSSAVNFYNEAVKIIPESRVYRENLAMSFYMSKKYNEAYNQYIKLVSDTLIEKKFLGKSHFMLGLSLIQLDSIEQACSELRKSSIIGFNDANKVIAQYCN